MKPMGAEIIMFASRKSIDLAVVQERARCAGLIGLAAEAIELGVSFDAGQAIQSRMSVDDAVTVILTTHEHHSTRVAERVRNSTTYKEIGSLPGVAP